MIKNALVTGSKIIWLTIIAALITLVVSALTASTAPQATDPAQAGAALWGVLIVAFVDALVLVGIIKLSRWAGLALVAGLAFSYFGVKTFLGQIEALAFLTPMANQLGSGTVPVIAMPLELIAGMFVVGIALALIVVPLAVRLFGKAQAGAGEPGPRWLPSMDLGQWAGKLLAVIVVYELLYFGFGYAVTVRWQICSA
ncbi:MAG: hypothetical protein P8X95_21150 [Anaerolineales bacterium]|jgi:uncharacterized membrane protein YqhA